jgi:hypothetical protein
MSDANFGMCQDGKMQQDTKWLRMNPIVDIKDPGRFCGTDTVPIDVFNIGRIKTPSAVFHNSGHYMSPETILQLGDRNPELRMMYISTIFPLGALKSKHSYERDFCDWIVDGNTLVYIPERHTGGKYEQPFDPTLLLSRTIIDKTTRETWRGGVVESCGNTYAQVWYKYALVVPKTIVLQTDQMMSIPRVFRGMPKDLPMVPVEFYRALYEYGKVLVAALDKDLWGKIRQFADDKNISLTIIAKGWLVRVILHILQTSYIPRLQSKFYQNTAQMLYYKTIGHTIRFIHEKLDMRYAKRNSNLIEEETGLHVFKLMDVVVTKKRMKPGDEYGIEWFVPKEAREGFWGRISNWLTTQPLGPHIKCDPKLCGFQEDGKVIWNQPLGLTSRNVREWGIDVVRASQIKDFLVTFEGGVPNPPVENDHYYGEPWMRTELKLAPADLEIDQADDSDSSSDSDSESKANDSDSTAASSIYEASVLPPLELPVCCDECPTFTDYCALQGVVPDSLGYNTHVRALHEERAKVRGTAGLTKEEYEAVQKTDVEISEDHLRQALRFDPTMSTGQNLEEVFNEAKRVNKGRKQLKERWEPKTMPSIPDPTPSPSGSSE